MPERSVRSGHDGLFGEIAAVADAVAFEGYLLYPYRASAAKNKVRWQWGVLMPAEEDGAAFGADSGETSANRAEFLVEPRGLEAVVHLRVRFLQLEQRTVLDATGREVDALEAGGARYVPFAEGVPRWVDASFTRAGLLAGATVPIDVPGREEVEEIGEGTGVGRVVRSRLPLSATATVGATELAGPYDVLRVRVDVRNDATAHPDLTRDDALRSALVGTHLMLAVEPGAFLSPTDPPEWAAPFVAECHSEHLWPALAGPEERSDLLLCAPIILADHTRIAPESPVDLFDGTENDELLALRTLTLTDTEKAEARATDPRAAAIVDAVDAFPPEIWERLHGAIRSMRPARDQERREVPTFTTPAEPEPIEPRPKPGDTPWWDPAAEADVDPDRDSVLVEGVPVARGSKVVLRPAPGADAQDAFLTGRPATVQAVVHDVDGTVHVAVSLDIDTLFAGDNPDGGLEAELALAHGRFRYFRPEELEVAAGETRREVPW